MAHPVVESLREVLINVAFLQVQVVYLSRTQHIVIGLSKPLV
jgi:hypothetical protein